MEGRLRPAASATAPDGERPFLRYLEEVRPEVNERISSALSALDAGGGLDPRLAAVLGHGKRLRAGICLLSFDALSGRPGARGTALDLAAAIEIAHSASLILDDMLDGDEERRGMPALHISRGQKRALLEVIALLSLPYTIAARHGGAYVAGLAATQRRMAGGARTELEAAPFPPAFRRYEEVITGKTGDLFGLAARSGAEAGGCPPELADRAGSFGVLVGKAMQVADDIADLRAPSAGRRGPGGASELLLLRCGGPDETLAEAIAAARSSFDRLSEAASEAPPASLARMRALRSSPSEIAELMLSEGQPGVSLRRHPAPAILEPPGIKPK